MTDGELELLAKLISEVASDDGRPWRDKAEDVLAQTHNGNLAEFIGWFTVTDEGDVEVAR